MRHGSRIIVSDSYHHLRTEQAVRCILHPPHLVVSQMCSSMTVCESVDQMCERVGFLAVGSHYHHHSMDGLRRYVSKARAYK